MLLVGNERPFRCRMRAFRLCSQRLLVSCTMIARGQRMSSLLRSAALAVIIVVSASLSAPALAQMPGQPVLQNAFTNPGWAFGVNYGDSDEALGFGGAVGWGVASGKLGGSVGAGIWDPEFGDNVFAWGGRAMWSPLRFLQEKVGVGAFAGIGGARQDTIDIVQAPAGVAVGYRTAIGDTRAVSVYAAPFLSLSRLNFGGGAAETTTLFRASVGIDAAVLPKVGVTLGYEFGATAKEGEFGPGGGIFGIGVSYVMR